MKLNIEKIDKELKRLGWTKYQLAMKMEVKPQWIYQILSSKYNGLTLKSIDKIAKALELDSKDLII